MYFLVWIYSIYGNDLIENFGKWRGDGDENIHTKNLCYLWKSYLNSKVKSGGYDKNHFDNYDVQVGMVIDTSMG